MDNASIKLASLAGVQIGFQSRAKVESDSNSDHFLIQMADIQLDGNYTSTVLRRVAAGEWSESYAVEPGIVLFQARGSVNRAHVVRSVPGPTMASNHFYILRPDLTRVEPGYLAWAINSTPVQQQIAAHAQGATVSLVSRGAFESIEIPVPSLEVQRKIARLASLQRREAELMEHYISLRGMLVERVSVTSATGSEYTGVRD